MLKKEIERLTKDYGVKREAIISQLNSNRVTFGKKLKDNSFDQFDRKAIYDKWGALL